MTTVNENNKRRHTVSEENDTSDLPKKHTKSQYANIENRRKDNFIKACKIISEKAYYNIAERLQLFFTPICMNNPNCKHDDPNFSKNILEMPCYAKQPFDTEIKANMWCKALEVCILCITPNQYLSGSTLKDIADIILNAHEDTAGYPISHVIEKCQLVFSLQFSMHPPCFHTGVRKCYNDFLTSPIDLKEDTYSIRKDVCDDDDGIIAYCMDRLEEELSPKSVDGPLVNMRDIIPCEVKQTFKEVFWKNHNLAIFETLERSERIKRLMAILHSVTELLQFDIAIRQTRRSSSNTIRRRDRLLIENILWKHNLLNGQVTKICTQILKIYCYFIHLDYPDHHIRTIGLWVNLVIETFYINSIYSNTDYPNYDGQISVRIINELDKIISTLPTKSIIKILERIQPLYIRKEIGLWQCRRLLGDKIKKQNDIMKMFIEYLEQSCWNKFPKVLGEISEQKNLEIKQLKLSKLITELSNMCENPKVTTDYSKMICSKYDCENIPYGDADESHVTNSLCITLKAYLDMYNIKKVLSKLNDLNTSNGTDSETLHSSNLNSYTVTISLIQEYRYIVKHLKEIIMKLNDMTDCELPKEIINFRNMYLQDWKMDHSFSSLGE